MSWISGTYMSVDYAWPLPEANSITVHNLYPTSVSSLPLSVTIPSSYVCVNLSRLCSGFLSGRRCTLAVALHWQRAGHGTIRKRLSLREIFKCAHLRWVNFCNGLGNSQFAEDLLGRAWVSPTLAGLHSTCACVCLLAFLLACGHIRNTVSLWGRWGGAERRKWSQCEHDLYPHSPLSVHILY